MNYFKKFRGYISELSDYSFTQIILLLLTPFIALIFTLLLTFVNSFLAV